MIDNRPRLNYPGNVDIELGAVMGPNLFQEFLAVQEVSYNIETDTTHVVFRYATADESRMPRACRAAGGEWIGGQCVPPDPRVKLIV